MNPALGLAAARIGVGAVALANPDLAAKSFGLDPGANPQLAVMTRLFGSREILLGAVTLLAKGRAKRGLILAGVLIDAADAAAVFQATRDGIATKETAAALGGAATGAVFAGLAGARGHVVKGSSA